MNIDLKHVCVCEWRHMLLHKQRNYADNITKATSYDVRTNFQFQADTLSLLYIRVCVCFFFHSLLLAPAVL